MTTFTALPELRRVAVAGCVDYPAPVFADLVFYADWMQLRADSVPASSAWISFGESIWLLLDF